jgi:hypothetical protein
MVPATETRIPTWHAQTPSTGRGASNSYIFDGETGGCMHFRHLTFLCGLALVLSLAPGQVAAQSQPVNAKTSKAPSQTWKPARTIDGQPDLQGVWANNNATPLQRPKVLEGRKSLTDAEVAALKKKAAELYDGVGDTEFGDTVFETVWTAVQNGESGTHRKGLNGVDAKTGFDAGTGDYSSAWLAARDWDNRTSLIIDPPNGRFPEMTPAGKQAAAKPSYDESSVGGQRPDSYENLSLGVRCITFGSPRLGAGYNSYYQIVQSAKSVVFQMEMAHDARIIPIDGSPHLPSTVKLWLGDSRGHWEGDTLVVDTTNYRAGAFMNASDQLHVIERFTRSSPEVLQYQVTIEDPVTWTKPWTVMIPLRHSKDAMYEYACHEGNYGMAGILAGARAEDKAAEESAKKGLR